MKRLKEFEKTAKKDIHFGKNGKRKLKQATDPNKPKRSDTAYVMFVKDRMADVKAAHPTAKQNELFTIIAGQWSSADSKLKEANTQKLTSLSSTNINPSLPYLIAGVHQEGRKPQSHVSEGARQVQFEHLTPGYVVVVVVVVRRHEITG